MEAPLAAKSEHRLPLASFPSDSQRSDNGHRASSQSDGRDPSSLETPPHPLHSQSSPAAASVDSFSSYINKDAPLFQQNRSSSPRPAHSDEASRELSDPASRPASPRPAHQHPRHLVTTPIVSRDAFRHPQHWSTTEPRATPAIMSIESLHSSQPSTLPRRDEVPPSPTPAIDVNRLSVSNLAQKNHEDNAADPSYLDARAGSILADDSFESTASVAGEDAKNEIRRRRRTRPDEANLLAQVYAKNAFPDHETRLFLANRVGMSVRAVSVWFQNRRQAEKKRSGRYGGPAPTATTGSNTPAPEESPAKPLAALPTSDPALSQRKPLGNASANGAAPTKRFDPLDLQDLSSNNKENIPPWLVTSKDNSIQRQLEKVKPLAPLVKQKEVLTPAARDLRQIVGPQGGGIVTANRVEVDPTPAVEEKSSLSRHASAPRLSLDDLLSGRSNSLRRAATENGTEQLSTILPPPKLLSRASSSSSLGLLTTSGGRASIGSLTESPLIPSLTRTTSLTSALPPKLTAALQRQGIIATTNTGGLLQMMPSSSASSSEADPQADRGEEDEERTLKLIAQRRAAKAQATALAKAQEAREKASAIAPPMDPNCADARVGMVPAKKGVVGLAPARQLSLDWAAGRDRANTSALPKSIGGTSLSRSVSAKLVMESTPLQQKVGTQGSAKGVKMPSRRSLSATDLTRRLQEAKKKGDGRKRPAPVVGDENAPPTQVGKKRKAEDVVPIAAPRVQSFPSGIARGDMSSPHFLPRSSFASHSSFPSTTTRTNLGPTMIIPSTPQSTTSLYSTLPLSTRSDRFRAIGASPATALGRSISANYPSRYPSAPSWTPRSSITASTPSRVLGDRTNFSSQDSTFGRGHDDSGFFEGSSDDEGEDVLKGKKGAVSPRKASLRGMRVPDSGEDQQAAELLLGLGKRNDSSRDGSSQ